MLKKLTAMLTAIVMVVGMIAVPAKAENVQYTDITIDSIYTNADCNPFYNPQIHPGKGWRIYLRPSIDLTDRIGVYHLTINNGVEDRVVDFYVEDNSTNQIYTVNLPKDFVNADGTQTLTLKKGTYQADSKQYGINLTQDFAIYINNGSWSSDQTKVNPTSGVNANLTLNLTPNDQITTGGSVNGVYLTADIETDAQITIDKWPADYDLKPLESATDGSVFHLGSGIFKGDKKLSYRLIKYTKTGYYVDTNGEAETDVEYTVKGLFKDKNGKVFGFNPVTVSWDGSKWTQKKVETPDTDVTTYDTTLTTEGAGGWDTANTGKNIIYMHGSDNYLSDLGEDWDSANRQLIAADDNSGAWLGDKKLQKIEFKKIVGGVEVWNATSVYFIKYNDTDVTVAQDTILTIKGTFITGDNKAKIHVAESKFQWNGSKWESYKAPQQYTGKLTLDDAGWYAENANIESTKLYVHGTDTYLDSEGEGWNEDRRVFLPEDAESGIYIGNRRWPELEFQKFRGGVADGAKHMWYITKFSAKEGQVLTVKGNFVSKDGKVKINFTESKFVWTGAIWQEYVPPVPSNETDRTLKLDTETDNGGNQDGIYLATDDGFVVDGTWSKEIKAVAEAGTGIYYNDKKIDAPLFKYTDGHLFLGLVNAKITAKDKDKVVIKGTFVLDDYRVTYKEVSFYYNGQVWATTYKSPEKVTYTDITLDEMLDVTMYREAEERWDIYLSTKGKLPGVGDKISFGGIKVVIDGQEQTIGAFHAAHEDSFFFILDKTMLAKRPEKNIKIVIKAGEYKSSDVTKGIRIKKDYTIYANQYGLSTKHFLSELVPAKKNIKLEIDRDLLYGGDGNGIYLLTGDKFPIDKSWQSSIRAVAYDENSGVFYNGKRINAVLKRFEDGKIYIGLVDGGVVAQDKDKVVIKGLFQIGEHVMSYAEHTFYYNGKTWNTTYFKQKTKQVKISGVSINEVTSYDAERKWWNVYVNLKGKLPGEIDRTQFNGLDIIVNGKMLESKTTFHSYMDTLYFPIPKEYLAEDAKNGIEIVIKKGKAEASDRINEIIWTEDFKFYTFAGSLTEVKPTTNTKWVKSEISLFKTAPYHEDWNAWQILVAVKEPFNTESGTYYYQLPVEINGKQYKVRAIQSGTNLAFDVTKDMVDPNSNNGVIKIKAGATALANAGKDGVHLTNDLTVYLFNKTWSDKKYTKVSNIDVNMVGVQDSTYVKNPDGSAYTNMYVWMDTKMPGRAWFESYLVPVLYNGKEVTVQMERVVSKFGRLMYFGLAGTPKDGDTVTFKAGTKAEAGGIGFTIKNTYTLIYKNGQWSEYVKSDMQKPKAEKSLWDVARFDSSYIPYTKSGVVTFSNTDKHSVITSVEPMKDYTIKFKARKLDDNDESSPNFSVMLRANAIDDKTPISTDALYGYVVTFQYNQLSLYKNHVNWELTDAYRLAYEPLEENEKYFEFGEDYEYEFSIYNVTDTCACITISVNGVEQIRYYDHASEDAKDPVVNAGDFRIYAECTTAIMSSVATTDELIISEETTETNKGVYVAASYPYVDEDTEFTVSGTGAFVEDGIFKATEPGTYTVSATYKGKAVEPKTITVTATEKKTDASEEEVIYEEVINWPVVIAMAAGAVVALLALVLVVIKLKKKKTGKSEVE